MRVIRFENRWHVETRDVDGSLALACWAVVLVNVALFWPIVRWVIWGTR